MKLNRVFLVGKVRMAKHLDGGFQLKVESKEATVTVGVTSDMFHLQGGWSQPSSAEGQTVCLEGHLGPTGKFAVTSLQVMGGKP